MRKAPVTVVTRAFIEILQRARRDSNPQPSDP